MCTSAFSIRNKRKISPGVKVSVSWYFHTSATKLNKGKGKASNTHNSINSNDTQLNTPVIRDG